jgi:hypothetical protein
VMSFEEEHELFMRTSFTTKFLDYAAFGKPILLWGPDYCTPSRLAVREDAAVVVPDPDPAKAVSAAESLRADRALREKYAAAACRLRDGLFNPDRLQDAFVKAVSGIARG